MVCKIAEVRFNLVVFRSKVKLGMNCAVVSELFDEQSLGGGGGSAAAVSWRRSGSRVLVGRRDALQVPVVKPAPLCQHAGSLRLRLLQ